MSRKEWYTLEDVEELSVQERIDLTVDYVNPGMAKLFKILGFDKIWPISAEGMYLNFQNGRKILDMTGGNCVLGLGHNHPKILACRKKIAEEKRLELCKSFLSPYIGVLAANMANLLPGDLKYSFFCGSGAEAVEGALKLAQKHHGFQRNGIVYTDHSFHGKTHAAMSVSSMDDTRHNFQLLDNCYQVPYGDAKALEAFFQSRWIKEIDKPDICAFILEAIHGTRLIFPSKGYLKEVRELCTKYDVLLIVDEIYTGFGRTGYWFAFESEDIVPDIVCYSKTFGGGKASIAGYTTRAPVFMKAYGKTDDSMMHSSTFSGMSEECATAIEAMNIIKDENLVEVSRSLGEYLGKSLRILSEKYPESIKNVRGRGLLWGVELKPMFHKMESSIKKVFPSKASVLPVLTGVVALTELFHSYDILAYLGFTRRNLIILSPSLIINKEEIDKIVDAIDKVLSKGWIRLASNFISRNI